VGTRVRARPHGLYNLTDEEKYIGRNYFARSPGSDVWVSFHDLPKAVCDRLRARISAGDFDDDDLGWLFDDTERGADADDHKDISQQPPNGGAAKEKLT
jgi:hypothetical protein